MKDIGLTVKVKVKVDKTELDELEEQLKRIDEHSSEDIKKEINITITHEISSTLNNSKNMYGGWTRGTIKGE